MQLQSAISLRFGGPGSGCNPAVAEPRCGRPSSGGEEKSGSREFTLPNGRVINVPFNHKKMDQMLDKVRTEEMAKLPQHVQDVLKAGGSTEDLFKHNGVWDHQRVIDVHGPIKAEYLMGLTAQANPKMVIIAGGTASGKSSASREALKDCGNNAMYMNSDDIRSMLPEIGAFVGNDKQGALHEEAGQVRDEILSAAIDSRYSMVIDAPGSKDVAAFADRAEKAGYRVSVSYVHRDVESAENSAFARKYDATILSDVRDVPRAVTEKSHTKARLAIEQLSKGREFKVYDREPDISKSNLVFSRSAKGAIDWTVYNQKRLEAISYGQSKKVPKIPDSVFEGF